MKVLLLQIRRDVMKEHERKCVVAKSGLSEQEIVAFDIFERLITADDLNGYDALVVGGSGGYCVSEREIPAEIDAMEGVIREARQRRMPVLGICFGHHLIAEALGGEVRQDRDRQEVGTFEVAQTAEAKVDPIFSHLPASFLAQEGHKDHVTKLPPGAVHLLSTPTSPLQAFTFPGEPIYSMQLHPELSKADVFERLDFYRSLYLKSQMVEGTTDVGAGSTEFDTIMSATMDTPEAEKILHLFFEEVVDNGKRYPHA